MLTKIVTRPYPVMLCTSVCAVAILGLLARLPRQLFDWSLGVVAFTSLGLVSVAYIVVLNRSKRSPKADGVTAGEPTAGPRKHWLGFPALLLVPAMIALWTQLCFVRRVSVSASTIAVWGIPVPFLEENIGGPMNFLYYDFHAVPFLFDLAIALGVAVLVALGADRVVLPKLRSLGR